MSVTRRGYGVCGICLLALALGAAFGARALNAVVVPSLVALAAGWVSMRRTPRPTVTRSRPAPGMPGDVREIVLDIGFGDDEADRSTSATVRETVGEGLSADASVEAMATGVPGRVTYDCRLDARGEHAIGPAIVTVTDPLGLFAREFRAARRTDALVYPAIRPLSGYAQELLGGDRADALTDDRGEFDSLREYVPGDPLRDVHWKSSAKRDAFVVTEFAADTEEEGLAIVAEAAPGQADGMAIAAASVACWLLGRGVDVELTTPNGRISEGGGTGAGREAVLGALARAGAGRVATGSRERADVVIAAEADGLTVTVGDAAIPFDRLVDPGATGRPVGIAGRSAPGDSPNAVETGETAGTSGGDTSRARTDGGDRKGETRGAHEPHSEHDTCGEHGRCGGRP